MTNTFKSGEAAQADVVITGLGTALAGVEAAADLLRTGPLPAGAADPTARLTGRGLRYKDRATKLALCAAGAALADAGLPHDPGLAVPGESVGVVVSSNFGNVDTICAAVDTLSTQGYLGTSPMALPATASNVTAAAVAIRYGLRGANLTLCNGPTSGLDAVHWARLLVAAGRVRRVLVVGVEPANPAVRHLVPGDERLLDGAVALVVESASAAAERSARVDARLGGYARTADHTGAVAAVRADSRPIGLWCVPDWAPWTDTVTAHDLTARYGRCSGALGVLQCVAGTAWLRAGGAGAVLASAGGDPHHGDDAAAALVLTGAGADR
jgi:3-oxoacyl-[acyl-carrier-protein] synthase II